ncbi:MAG TPA: DUF1592 domain-containing protein [Bryobacteraceae bacterium]|nr:DUF1592 domain-containing protein [Bryobacteraceae bacterium]
MRRPVPAYMIVAMRRLTLFLLLAGGAVAAPPPAAVTSAIARYCVGCHNSKAKIGGLALDGVTAGDVGQHAEVWEKVVRKLRARYMPPPGLPRPEEKTYDAIVSSLQTSLDSAAALKPDPGRTDTFRRLNRTEYRNAIRDLLALDVDVSTLLPNDESSHGFDNVTVGNLSPVLLEQYLSAAKKITRLAIGIAGRSPGGDTVILPPDLTQEEHFDELPFGTRGGTVVHYTFPVDAEYDFQLRLQRDRNEHVEGLTQPGEVELMLDGQRVKLFTVTPPKGDADHHAVDQGLNIRLAVKAGPHLVEVAFPKEPSVLLETERQPYQAHFNMDRHPRIHPAVFSVTINGPYDAEGPGDTPSRRRIFVCHPGKSAEENACATKILSTVMRRAYRRPVSDADLRVPMKFYTEARANGNFESAIEMGLRAVLVSPEFLFRVESDPSGIAPGTPYRIGDLELASRLSFFLWSSIPDDELLDAAIRGNLREPGALEHQVRRMLTDPRSSALTANFAGQWLHLRSLAAITPDMRAFPDFDDNLRQAFREETELFFESILREDRSVLDLFRANYTYVNERLAKHYGIPNIYGSRLRRITFDSDSVRGGLLRQGSILTVTSYATRTSPVIRGKWVLENLLGTAPPPPPPFVPPLKENTGSGKILSMRDRMAQHRANPACAGCHQLMDPVGFSLEHFDAVGRWRDTESGTPIDASGALPDGTKFDGVAGLQQALLTRPDLFASTLTEKLLTYALGRGTEYYDEPAVRRIVRDARAQDFRFSSFILGIVNSTPFQMRRSQ